MSPIPTRTTFPPPWTVGESGESFYVRDARGQVLGYFYFEDGEGRRSAMKRLNRADAWKMAVNFAKLPELLKLRDAAR